jgi:hypothetical protein
VPDVSPFSVFSYKDKEALDDFLLINALAHENYNTALELTGTLPATYPLLDIGDTADAKQDWLQTHYLMHKNIAALLGLSEIPDLSDVELHDDAEFYNWLQLHQQQHQLIDAALNL